jgi:hypothetical protein
MSCILHVETVDLPGFEHIIDLTHYAFMHNFDHCRLSDPSQLLFTITIRPFTSNLRLFRCGEPGIHNRRYKSRSHQYF